MFNQILYCFCMFSGLHGLMIRPAQPAPPPQPPFALRDIASDAGVRFRFENGSRGRHDLPEIMGGGVAILDVDGDGWLDLFFCNGGPIGAGAGRPDPPCRLFRNRGHGLFEDISASPGRRGQATRWEPRSLTSMATAETTCS
jgi:hypothetical protein